MHSPRQYSSSYNPCPLYAMWGLLTLACTFHTNRQRADENHPRTIEGAPLSAEADELLPGQEPPPPPTQNPPRCSQASRTSPLLSLLQEPPQAVRKTTFPPKAAHVEDINPQNPVWKLPTWCKQRKLKQILTLLQQERLQSEAPEPFLAWSTAKQDGLRETTPYELIVQACLESYQQNPVAENERYCTMVISALHNHLWEHAQAIVLPTIFGLPLRGTLVANNLYPGDDVIKLILDFLPNPHFMPAHCSIKPIIHDIQWRTPMMRHIIAAQCRAIAFPSQEELGQYTMPINTYPLAYPHHLPFNPTAPHFRQVVSGLNFVGRCKNNQCHAFKQYVVSPHGFSVTEQNFAESLYSFYIGEEALLACCPTCNHSISPLPTCILHACQYRYHAKTHDGKVHDGQGVVEEDQYCIFQHNGCLQTFQNWEAIEFLAYPLTYQFPEKPSPPVAIEMTEEEFLADWLSDQSDDTWDIFTQTMAPAPSPQGTTYTEEALHTNNYITMIPSPRVGSPNAQEISLQTQTKSSDRASNGSAPEESDTKMSRRSPQEKNKPAT